MPDSTATSRIRLTGPRDRTDRPFDLVPDDDARRAIARELDLLALKKLRFRGELRPSGAEDWDLVADLGATVVQPCGLTLEPVTTRIDEPVRRSYRAALDAAELSVEQEMPDATEEEPLPAVLDLAAVMLEALSLAVPAFPRAPGAEIGAVETADPDADPFPQEEKAFAGLKNLLKTEKP